MTASGRLLDAALQADRMRRRDVAQAFANQCLCEHGGSGGSVAGDVIGLLGDLLDELRTDLLMRVVSSISLAMETPSLVIVGAPHFFSRTTLRPRRPRSP